MLPAVAETARLLQMVVVFMHKTCQKIVNRVVALSRHLLALALGTVWILFCGWQR